MSLDLLRRVEKVLWLLSLGRIKVMWIVSPLKAIGLIALVSFLLGCACGVSATRAHAHSIYISVEARPSSLDVQGDSLADNFFGPTNVDNSTGVAVAPNEFAALHVEQGEGATIPETSTLWLVLIGLLAVAARRYWLEIQTVFMFAIVTVILMTSGADATPPFIPAPFAAPDIPLPAARDGASFAYSNTVVTMTGQIEAETPYMLDYYIKANHWTVNELSLNSPGGNVAAAYQLAAMVTKNHWHTMAGECQSACVLVWSAGIHHLSPKGYRFGFHQATNSTSFGRVANDPVTGGMARYLTAHGAPPIIVRKMLSTPPTEVYHPFDVEMAAWK